jgi:hypothetical protein
LCWPDYLTPEAKLANGIPLSEIEHLRSLLEDLVRAVEPFAEYADNFSTLADEDAVWGRESGSTFLKRCTIGDLRRAREAYLKAKGE